MLFHLTSHIFFWKFVVFINVWSLILCTLLVFEKYLLFVSILYKQCSFPFTYYSWHGDINSQLPANTYSEIIYVVCEWAERARKFFAFLHSKPEILGEDNTGHPHLKYWRISPPPPPGSTPMKSTVLTNAWLLSQSCEDKMNETWASITQRCGVIIVRSGVIAIVVVVNRDAVGIDVIGSFRFDVNGDMWRHV